MLRHSDSKKINNSPLLSLSLSLSLSLPPPHLRSESDRCGEKMKLHNNRKVRTASGMRCVLSRDKRKTRESNMRSNQYDSALCPLAFHMSETIFKDHQMQDTHTHTHTHTAEMHGHNNCCASAVTICDPHTSFHMSKDIILVASH